MSLIYPNIDKFISEIENKIGTIYKKLLHKPGDNSSINSFNKIIKNFIDINKTLLPISKSLEGDILLTSSKIWVIIILIKISQSNQKQIDFLTLVDASLTHLLNEYVEYKKFFIEQCEILFDDKLAISKINANPKFQRILKMNEDHENVKNNFIYLLSQVKKFKKSEFDLTKKIKTSVINQYLYNGIKKSREMRIFEEILVNNEMIQRFSAGKENKNKKIILNDKMLSNDEENKINKSLNEIDMNINKNISSKIHLRYWEENYKSLDKNKNNKKEEKKEVSELVESKLNKNNQEIKNENIKDKKKYDKDLIEIDTISNKKSGNINIKNIRDKNESKGEESTKLISKFEETNNELKGYNNITKINIINKSYPLKKIYKTRKNINSLKQKKAKKEKSQKRNQISPKRKKSHKK